MDRNYKDFLTDVADKKRFSDETEYAYFTIIRDKDTPKNVKDEAKKRIICLADFLQHHPGQKTVPDPYYGGPKDFELALDLIEDACGGLFDWLLVQ